MDSPLFRRQFEPLPENGFGSLVIEVQSLCEGLQSVGRCPYGAHMRSMNHKSCICASLAFLSPEVRQGGNGAYLSAIVDSQSNVEIPEQIKKANAVARVSTSGLHQQMNVVNVGVAGCSNAVKHSLYRSLVDYARKGRIYLDLLGRWQRRTKRSRP
jgi:hypothetical protein